MERALVHGQTSGYPVVIDDASKIYRSLAGEVAALDAVSLTIGKGEMVAIVGPSGCGKTTLLNLIGCVDTPSRGRVLIDGSDTTLMSERSRTQLRRDRVGSVFQFFNLLSGLSVENNVAIPLLLQHTPGIETRRRVDATLHRVGILEQKRKQPNELSGGQQQRVAIARALIHEPAILIADEPTGNLDAANARMTIELFRSLADDGQTIILATHAAEAAVACDRTISMRDGRIVT